MAYITNNDNLEIARGNIDQLTSVNKFGANVESANGVLEDVWDGGGTYSFPATALITKLSQTTNQVAMLGANIEVQGLDINWDQVTQTKALDGSNTTTAVTLDTPLLRIFRMKVLADVVNDSPIRAHNDAESVDYAIISIGKNQTLMAIYTVPRNKTAYITNYYYDYIRDSVKDPDSVNFILKTADRANGYEFQVKHEVGLPKLASGRQHEFKPYYQVREKTDIKMSAIADGADANVHAGFDIILANS